MPAVLPVWACLTRVWLEGYGARPLGHGRMGWVVAVIDDVEGGLYAARMHEWLRRQPHTRNRAPYWHPPMIAYHD